MNYGPSQIEQWMPNGWGNQMLYRLRLEFQEEGGSIAPFALEDRIAFRTVELIEEDMSGTKWRSILMSAAVIK